MSTRMGDTSAKLRFRDVLGVRFWLNYAVILVVTCWMPLLNTRVVMKDASGKVVEGVGQSVRVYQSYYQLLHGANYWHGIAVALHLGICFIVAFAVWYGVLRARLRAESVAPSAPREDECHE
jgi:hypothetical protein